MLARGFLAIGFRVLFRQRLYVPYGAPSLSLPYHACGRVAVGYDLGARALPLE